MIGFHFGQHVCSLGLCLILCCFGSIVSATTDPGRVSGNVFDPRGDPVAGAHLKLVNTAGTLILQTTSDEQGNFVLNGIDTGEYQLTAEDPSFASKDPS